MHALIPWHVTILVCSSFKPQSILQMLEPFIKFVLMDPKVTVGQLVRQQLLTGLLQTAVSSLVKCPGILQSTLCQTNTVNNTMPCSTMCCSRKYPYAVP